MNGDEATLSRRRASDLADAIPLVPPGGDAGAETLACKTIQIAAYPTTAGVYYGVVPCDLGGNEIEGVAGTIAPQKGTFRALNLGPNVPPVATTVVVRRASGRWVFRF